MKKISRIAFAALALASFAAVAADAPPAPQLPKCDKPIASVVVNKLSCKAANCNSANQGQNPGGLAALLAAVNGANGGGNVSGIADGIKDVLVTALTESGCFDVQDREQLAEIQAELALAGKKVETEQAEFMVSGAITQIDVSTETKSFGGGFIPIIGSVGTKTQKAAVALDMKLVSISNAKVVGSKRAQASSENSSFSMGAGAIGPIGGGFGGFGGSFSSLKGTNLEAVTKDAIIQSVTFLVDSARAAKTVASTAQAAAPVAQAAAPTQPGAALAN